MIYLTGSAVFDLDATVFTVKCNNLRLQAHIDFEPLAEKLRRGNNEVFFLLDHIAHEIGQTAVGERNIFAAIEHDDFRRFRKPAGARCTGGATGNTADN